MSERRRLSFERVLKPEGVQFTKASRRYFWGSWGGVLVVLVMGSRMKNSVSMFEPSNCSAVSASLSSKWSGECSPVTVLRRVLAVAVVWYMVGKRVGRYVDVSHVYSSKTAGRAIGLHARTS